MLFVISRNGFCSVELYSLVAGDYCGEFYSLVAGDYCGELYSLVTGDYCGELDGCGKYNKVAAYNIKQTI